MPGYPNMLSQFWQVFKHRRVVRVIAVYAASAFVILELVDIITEPLGLPDWKIILVVVLLAVGFKITVVILWIYNIHPEGGMEKTEPAQEVQADEIVAASNGWKITSHISFEVIVGLIVLNFIPRPGKNEILEKSIAVRSFQNDSPDQGDEV